MAKVFVSYSRKDIEFAKRLTAELQKSDLDFWIDWEGIPPTVDWWREIEKGIEEADVFIFVISPDSAKSKICGKEIDCAVKNGKRLIPLVVREIKGDETPAQLSHLNWIFFRENDDFDAGLKKLLTGIHTDYEWVQEHRWLQVRALDWQRQNKDSGALLRGKDLQDAEFQLATNTSKEPHPTDLQREYVFASRKAAERQRNITIGIAIAGAIALAALAVWGWGQAGLATFNANEANKNAANANAASTLAFENAIKADHEAATAQAASTLAVFNEKEAERQAQIALARQWAAEANALLASPNGNAETAALLSLQALKEMYIPSADAALVASLNRLYTAKVFDQHNAKVSTVAYSPKGDRISIGYIDGTAELYDVKTGGEIRQFDGFAGYYDSDNDPFMQGVHAVAFSSTGDLLLVAGSDGHILVWNLITDTMETEFTFQENLPLWSAKFSPDEKYILIGTGYPHAGPGSMYLFERETGELKYTFPQTETQTRYITDVEFSGDGLLVLSSSYDGTAILWDIDWDKLNASPRQTFKSTTAIRDGALSANNEYVLLGGDTNNAELYLLNGTPKIKFVGHTDAIFSVNFSPIEGYVLTGSWDGTVRLWDMESGKIIRTFVNHKDWVLSTAFSPDGHYVLTGSYDKKARLWAASPIHDARTLHGHTAEINLVAYSPDGQSILSSSSDNSVRLWNSKTLEPQNTLSTSLLDPKAIISAQGKWIVASSGVYQGSEYKIVFWEKMSSGYKQVDFPVDPWLSASRITSLAFSPEANGNESRDLLVGLEDGTLGHLQNHGGKWEVVKWYYGPSFPADVAFTSDLKYIVSTSKKHEAAYAQVPIFSIEDESTVFADCISALSSGTTFGSDAIAFSAEMNYLVAESGNDILILDWQPEGIHNMPHACSVTERLSGHSAPVTDLIFSPAGNYLLSTSLDGTAILWDIKTGEIRRILTGHEGEITSASFSTDGNFIVTGGADKTIRIWDTNYQNTIDTVCSLLEQFHRDFTPEERTKYEIHDNQPTCE